MSMMGMLAGYSQPMTRKVYVLRYWPLPVDKTAPPPPHRDENWRNWKVAYGAEPEWTFPERMRAEEEHLILRSLNVHFPDASPVHHCDFAVERLESGEFTIVCLSHPEEAEALVWIAEYCSEVSSKSTMQGLPSARECSTRLTVARSACGRRISITGSCER